MNFIYEGVKVGLAHSPISTPRRTLTRFYLEILYLTDRENPNNPPRSQTYILTDEQLFQLANELRPHLASLRPEGGRTE